MAIRRGRLRGWYEEPWRGEDDNRKWHEKREFLELRREWYDKLAEEGFRDCERIDWDCGHSSHLFQSHAVTGAKILHTYGSSWPLYEEFYRLAGAHTFVLEEEDHPDDLMEAWRMFVDGVSFREIERQTGTSRKKVSQFVKEQSARFWRLK